MSSESPRAEDMRMDVGAILGAVLSRWLRILIVTALLVGITYAILVFTPRMYESSASILVESRDNAFTGPTTGTSTGGAAVTIDSVISSQMELIKSRDTLLKVVDAVNLRSEPEFNGSGPNPLNLVFQLIGKKPEQKSIDDTVLANLNDRLTVIRERDSAIISIFVRSQNPQLAADIANAIAAEHVKRRADQSLQDTAEASTWLEQEIVSLRQHVADAETAVANFRSQNDLFDGPNNTSLVDQQLANISSQITDAQQKRNAAQTRAALIRGMINAGQPIDGLADVQNSAVIQQLSQSKADLQGQLAQKSSTLLPNHPTIRALNAQIKEIDRQIAAEGQRVASSLEAEAKIESDLEQSLQDELTKVKQSATNAATHTVTLDQLEREAKAQRDLLESYLLRYRDAASRSDSASALPDVRVVSLAAPAITPASPKTALVLGAVTFGALALQIGAIMLGELVSGRAVVQRMPLSPGRAPLRSGEPFFDAEPPANDDSEEPLLPFDAPVPAPAKDSGGQALSAESQASHKSADRDETTIVVDAHHVATLDDRASETDDRLSRNESDASDLAVEPEIMAAIESLAPGSPVEPFRPVTPVAQPVAHDELLVAAETPERETLEFGDLKPGDGVRTHGTEAALEALAAAMAEELADTSRLDTEATAEAAAASAAALDADASAEADEVAASVSLDENDATEEAATSEDDEPAPAVGAQEPEPVPVAVAEAEAVAEPKTEPATAEAAPVAPATVEPESQPIAAPAAKPDVSDHTGRYPSAMATLAADMALGRVRVVMIAGLGSADDCLPLSDTIVAEALFAGLSIVRVDAGTAETSADLGLTDLAGERASFGDVIHKGSHQGLSEVPWGQQAVLDRRSSRPSTLIEALMDIYEIVVVLTGRVGLSSTLPLFTGIDCRLVLGSVGRPSPDHIEAALADTAALGFRNPQVIVAPMRHAEVA